MSKDTVVEYCATNPWSITLAVVAAVTLCWTLYRWFKDSKRNKKTDVEKILQKISRISGLEAAGKVGAFKIGALINDGILTTEIIDEIKIKCVQHDIKNEALDNFINYANKALANSTWKASEARELVRLALLLKAEIKKDS